MIYTVTLNPALDYIVNVPEYIEGEVNRAETERISAGGKGINVSLALNNMGVRNTALGFTAGFTGAQIRKILAQKGCDTDFIELDGGFSRINVKIKGGAETEINGNGPVITRADTDALVKKLGNLSENDILVLSGSAPPSLPSSIYGDIMNALKDKKIKTVVDASGDLLMSALKYKPFLIKPNHKELGEIFSANITSRREAAHFASKLCDMGAQNVLVSMAGSGAVLVRGDGTVYEKEAPKGAVVNSTGAGDSMVAGFIAGFFKSGNFEEALKTGVAAGSASAFCEEIAPREMIKKIYGQL